MRNEFENGAFWNPHIEQPEFGTATTTDFLVGKPGEGAKATVIYSAAECVEGSDGKMIKVGDWVENAEQERAKVTAVGTDLHLWHGERQTSVSPAAWWRRIDAVTGSDGRAICVGDWVQDSNNPAHEVVEIDSHGLALKRHGVVGYGFDPVYYRRIDPPESERKPDCGCRDISPGSVVRCLEHLKPEPVCEACGGKVAPHMTDGLGPIWGHEFSGVLVCSACLRDETDSDGEKLKDRIRANRAARATTVKASVVQPAPENWYDSRNRLCPTCGADRKHADTAYTCGGHKHKPLGVGSIASWSGQVSEYLAAMDWMFLVQDLYAEQVNTGGNHGELAQEQCFATVANEFNRLARLALKIESQLRFVHAGFCAETEPRLRSKTLGDLSAEIEQTFSMLENMGYVLR